MKELKFNDIENETLINTFNYSNNVKNWINENTGELFVQDDDFEKLRNEKFRKKKLERIIIIF